MEKRRYKVAKKKKREKGYASDLSDAEWALIEPYLRQKPGRGRKRTVNIRAVVNAIFYMNRTGCQWRFLPNDFPDYHVVEYYFRTWSWDGTWERINTALREQVRVESGKEPTPSLAIIDSQSVKTTEVGGDDGFDGGKRVNGRKRHVIVDTLGLLLKVIVDAASISDTAGGEELLASIRNKFPRLEKVLADQGYGSSLIEFAKKELDVEFDIVERPEGQKGFQVWPIRWIIERSFGWLNKFRRLSKDYEFNLISSESHIYLAFIRLMLGRLTIKPVRPV